MRESEGPHQSGCPGRRMSPDEVISTPRSKQSGFPQSGSKRPSFRQPPSTNPSLSRITERASASSLHQPASRGRTLHTSVTPCTHHLPGTAPPAAGNRPASTSPPRGRFSNLPHCLSSMPCGSSLPSPPSTSGARARRPVGGFGWLPTNAPSQASPQAKTGLARPHLHSVRARCRRHTGGPAKM